MFPPDSHQGGTGPCDSANAEAPTNFRSCFNVVIIRMIRKYGCIKRLVPCDVISSDNTRTDTSQKAEEVIVKMRYHYKKLEKERTCLCGRRPITNPLQDQVPLSNDLTPKDETQCQ